MNSDRKQVKNIEKKIKKIIKINSLNLQEAKILTFIMQKSIQKQEVVFHLERFKTVLAGLSPYSSPSAVHLLATMRNHPLFHASVCLNYIGVFSFTGFTEKHRQLLIPVHCENKNKPQSGLQKRVIDSPLVDESFWKTADSTFLYWLLPSVIAAEMDDGYFSIKMKHLRYMLGKDQRFASCLLEGNLVSELHETLLSVALSNTDVPLKFVMELYELGSRIHPLRYSRFLLPCGSFSVLKRVTDFEAEILKRGTMMPRSLSSPANVVNLSEKSILEIYTL